MTRILVKHATDLKAGLSDGTPTDVEGVFEMDADRLEYARSHGFDVYTGEASVPAEKTPDAAETGAGDQPAAGDQTGADETGAAKEDGKKSGAKSRKSAQ